MSIGYASGGSTVAAVAEIPFAVSAVGPTLSVSGFTTSVRHSEDEEHAEVLTANGTCDARLLVTRERGS